MNPNKRTRVPVSSLAPGPRTLSAESSRYLCRVLRLREGAELTLFDTAARTSADATLRTVSDSACEVEVDALRDGGVVSETELVLVYALAKGDKVDAVVRDATELGASCVVIARTERSVVKADDARAEAKLERFRRVAEQAARQSGRVDAPRIEGVLDWGRALETAARIAPHRFCLDARGEIPLGPSLTTALADAEPVAFAVGSEGGLTDREVDEARALGFTVVSLGRFVLRTETVAAAVLGAVRVLSA